MRLTEPPYRVITASAGSGKTYTLALRFICLLLSQKKTPLANILAITFTNKATLEMKERILKFLHQLSQKEYDEKTEHLLKNIQQYLSLSEEEIRSRATKVFFYTLHHYHLLSISTLDAFFLRMVRSFAFELGLPHNFQIELSNKQLISNTIDELLAKLGTEDATLLALEEYILDENTESNSSSSPRKILLDKLGNWFEAHQTLKLEKFHSYTLEQLKCLQEKCNSVIHHSKKQIIELQKGFERLMMENDLQINDFAGGGKNSYPLQLQKISRWSSNNGRLPSIDSFYDENRFAKSASCKKNLPEHILQELKKVVEQTREYLFQIEFHQAIKKSLPEMMVLKTAADIFEELKKDNQTLILDDVGKIIHQHIKHEPSEFIFEKIGTRYHHYFFDEFQDTSELQWTNFQPLVDNARSIVGNSVSLIGDPKQSIYRFRGGRIEIMLNEIVQSLQTPEISIVELLDTNYRSTHNIVNFNNLIYADYEMDEVNKESAYNQLFKNATQKCHNKELGGVKAIVLSKDEESIKHIVACVQDALTNGFAPRDITVLTNTNKRAVQIADGLLLHGISSQVSKDRKLNDIPFFQLIGSYLRWLFFPEDKRNTWNFLFLLNELCPFLENGEDIHSKLTYLVVDETEKLENKLLELGFEVQFSNFSLSLIDQTEKMLHGLRLNEKDNLQPYIIFFLDKVLEFQNQGGKSLFQLYEHWVTTLSDTEISVDDTTEAVSVITVHASKGLQFPVVIYDTCANNDSKKESLWIRVNPNDYFGIDYLKISEPNAGNSPILNYHLHNEIHQLKTKKKVDEWCKHYVATTRAEMVLYLVLEQEKEFSELIKQNFGLVSIDELVSLFEPSDFKKKVTKDSEQYSELKLPAVSPSLNYTDWQTKFRLVTEEVHPDIFSGGKSIGEWVHGIVSKIKKVEEIDAVIQVEKNKYPQEHKTLLLLEEHVKFFFSDERWERILSEGKHFIERDILFEGVLLRPDRWIEHPEKTVLFDFKTGDERDSYQHQLKKYASALNRIGKNVGEAFLIFLLPEYKVVTVEV